MGILSKLFGKKSIESLKAFESELIKLHSKNYCDSIALIGTGGRLKGLPLIYASNNEPLLKRYAAQLNELIDPINKLTQSRKINRFVLYYEGNILIFKPLTDDVSFFAVTRRSNDIVTIQQWIKKNDSNLRSLFREKT